MRRKGEQVSGEELETRVAFQGFSAPRSNTLYTPNQFFDVVLPNSSRGAIRLVSYLLRKTLGWVDTEGNPKNMEAYASWKELETKAGIGHSMMKAVIEEAIDKRYIECLTLGAPHVAGQAGYSALYRLRWDHSDRYITDPEAFDGFYSANGNLTYIPNAFFDYLIPREKLSVIRVVGAIVRYTIGFKRGEGYRRERISMSLTELQRKTNLHRESASTGIQEALELGYLKREEEGVFSSDASIQRAATYSVRWEGEPSYRAADSSLKAARSPKTLRKSDQGSKPGHSENPTRDAEGDTPKIRPGDEDGTLRKSDQENGPIIRPEGRSEIPTSKPPVFRPGERSDNPTSIEITILNNTPKQQQETLDVEGGNELRSSVLKDLLSPAKAGFSRAAALRLMGDYPLERIRKVLDTLSVEGARSKPAVITSAVKDPTYRLEARPQIEPAERQFAGGFYEGRLDPKSSGEGSLATPTKADLEAAAPVVRRLLTKRTPGEPVVWGQSFGRFVRGRDTGAKKIATLGLAVKLHADDWVRSLTEEIEKGRRAEQEKARQSHQEAHSATYEAYLAAEAVRMEMSGHEAYRAFLGEIQQAVERIQRSNVRSERAKALALDDLTSEAGKRDRFKEFFVQRKMVMAFWEWDQRVNPRKFMEETA